MYKFTFHVARPNITKQPMSITIRAGSKNEVVMECKAIGIGSINYKWEKYQKIWRKLSNNVVKMSSSQLIFHTVEEGDEGMYRCIASNGYDSVVSDNATLTVYGTCFIY